jgi:hypothetical protein
METENTDFAQRSEPEAVRVGYLGRLATAPRAVLELAHERGLVKYTVLPSSLGGGID